MSQHLVVKQKSVADVWPLDEARWRSLTSHQSVARLTIVLAWPQPYKATSRRGTEREAATLFSLVTVIGLLLAFAIAVLGTISLYGALLEQVRSLPHYNHPRAQYSDVGKWQGHR